MAEIKIFPQVIFVTVEEDGGNDYLLASLTKQDALKLLEVVYNYPYDYKYLRYRNHAIFSTFIFAGLRKKELLNLRFTDVDMENLTIFVNQGKGSKDRI